MKSIRILLIALYSVFMGQVAFGQDVTANFVKVEKGITTTPEFPGICDPRAGVKVSVNEDFLEYRWIEPTNPFENITRTPLTGKEVTLTKPGTWKIICLYEVNGVTCSVSHDLFVADLNDPVQIQKYFENAGFYAIDIVRNTPTGGSSGIDCMPENISFGQGEKVALRPIIQGVYDNFKPLSSIGGGNIVISDNNCLCSQGASNLESQFNSGSLSVWAHQFFSTSNTLSGKLFIKGRMPFDEALPIPVQKSHLTSIHSQILSANSGTSEQGRVIFSNLFMPHPIGGYDLIKECDDPTGCYADGNFLTPSGIPIKLPEDASEFIFASSDKPAGVFEGALISMRDGTGLKSGYYYNSGVFAGYFNDITGTVKNGLITDNNPDQNNYALITRKCSENCKFIRIPYNNFTYNSESFGGINLELKQQVTDLFIIPCDDSGKRMSGNRVGDYLSFMTPTASIISLPKDQVNWVRFVYQEIETSNVEEIVGGMLWKYELEINEPNQCNYGTYTYQPDQMVFTNEDNVEYLDENQNIESFYYLLNTKGEYRVYSLTNVDRPKYRSNEDHGINLYESFTTLTQQVGFIPFANGYSPVNGVAEINIGANLLCSYCPSSETSNLIVKDDYSSKPEHIFVEKIAQLATVYPDYFKDYHGPEGGADPACYLSFTQKTAWEEPITGDGIPISWWAWRQYLEDNSNIAASFSNNKVLFFRTFIDQLMNEVVEDDGWWTQDIASKSVDEIICHLRGEPQSITSTKPWAKKQIALNKLYTTVTNPDAQYGIIHLLAASPAEMIDHVEEKTIQFYWDNFSSSEDDDNRSRIVNLICSKANVEYAFMQQYFNNPSSMPELEANIWNFNNLSPAIGSNFVTLNGPISSSGIGYNVIVPVKISGNFEIGSHSFQKGLILYVSSLQAALYAVKNKKAVEDRVAWAAVDLGLMFVGVGSYKYVWTGANYLRQGFKVADIIGSVLGITAQLLDNIDDDTRTKIQLAALVASGPEIGIALKDAVSATRLLRNNYPTFNPGILSANEVRLALAQKDLKDFADAWDFVRSNPKGANAWEMLIRNMNNASDILRKNKTVLEWFANKGLNIPPVIVDDLLAKINNPIKEVIEDAQGRLTLVLDRPGQSNQVVSLHKDVSGNYKTTVFDPAYNPALNPNIKVPLSANKLTPDFINTQYMHPLQGNTVVKIKLSGNRTTDFNRARIELDISSADETVNGVNHTWHHMDDFEIINGEAWGTMQLVQSSAHQGTGVFGMQHSGSVAQWRAYYGSGY